MKTQITIITANLILAAIIQYAGIEIITALTLDTDATRYIAQAVLIAFILAAFLYLTFRQLYPNTPIAPEQEPIQHCTACQKSHYQSDCITHALFTAHPPLCPDCGRATTTTPLSSLNSKNSSPQTPASRECRSITQRQVDGKEQPQGQGCQTTEPHIL